MSSKHVKPQPNLNFKASFDMFKSDMRVVFNYSLIKADFSEWMH